MDLKTLFLVALAVSPFVIWWGRQDKRNDNGEPSTILQTGYMALIVGVFGTLVMTFDFIFAADMLFFIVLGSVILLVDRLFFKPKRTGRAPDAVDYAHAFLPVLVIVFVLRSFLVEPFQIPSSSMRPGLIVGDFILVNKFAYGIRLPITNQVLLEVGKPARGDVMVFQYPVEPKINYIKRVIGGPGDVVEYSADKVLTINGKIVEQTANGSYTYQADSDEGLGFAAIRDNQQYIEQLDGHQHTILKSEGYPALSLDGVDFFKNSNKYTQPNACEYPEAGGFKCTVPAGHYFMMGDNRDNSQDGRYWGMVPDKLIVGKAFAVALNISKFPNNLGRMGKSIH